MVARSGFLIVMSSPSQTDSLIKCNENELIEACFKKRDQIKYKPRFYIIRFNLLWKSLKVSEVSWKCLLILVHTGRDW